MVIAIGSSVSPAPPPINSELGNTKFVASDLYRLDPEGAGGPSQKGGVLFDERREKSRGMTLTHQHFAEKNRKVGHWKLSVDAKVSGDGDMLDRVQLTNPVDGSTGHMWSEMVIKFFPKSK